MLVVMSLCAMVSPRQAMWSVLTLLSRRRLNRENFSIDANLERGRGGGGERESGERVTEEGGKWKQA